VSFKIAVIGCGYITGASHGPAYVRYAAQHADVELAACCDVDGARAEEFRARCGFARAYTDYLGLLDAEKPGAVCLNVPERLICEMGCRILEMGYPLLAEKPPGLTVEQVERLAATAETHGVLHQVALNRRHTPLVVELKRLLEGQPVHHVCLDFLRIGRTRYDFTTTAIHAVDTARFLLGCDYQHVRFQYQAFPDLGTDVANFFLDCVFTSGVTARLSISPVTGVSVERVAVHAVDHTWFLSLSNGPDVPGSLRHFEKGQLVLDLDGAQFCGSQDDYILSGFYAEDAAFFDAVRAVRQPADDFRSARQSVEVMQAMRERKPVYRNADYRTGADRSAVMQAMRERKPVYSGD